MTTRIGPQGPRLRRAPSQADVAMLAGVSPQTVSRVANGSAQVEAPTRERVLAAMRSLGYRPNTAARALATGRFRAIGVIASSITHNGAIQAINGVAIAGQNAGYSINLLQVERPTPDGYRQAAADLTGQVVDGLVIIQSEVLDEASSLVPADIPVVLTDDVDGDEYASVAFDQAPGVRQLVEHLLALGHRTVWHVAGPSNSYSAQLRERVWREVLMDHGCARIPQVLRGDWSARSGYAAGQELVRQRDVTAVFCANDQMALGLLHALYESGRSVPRDVSVVGFDDIAEAADFCPPLTTVRQDYEEVGRLCITMLLDQIAGGTGERHLRVPVELVLRESTAPPPARSGVPPR